MVTRLHGTLKRELGIKGRAYVVTLDENGIKLTLKGRRIGQQMGWEDFVNGEAAFAVALNASLAQANDEPSARETQRSRTRVVKSVKKKRKTGR